LIRHILSRWGLAMGVSLPLLAVGGVSPAAADAQNATITITDKGFNPANVSIGLGGTVIFTNSGTIVHTASTGGAAPTVFNTGGLAPSQSKGISFSLAGTYPFNSATDCMNGNTSQQFGCGGGTITVGPASAASIPASPAPAPVASAPVSAPAPATTVGGSAPATVTVTITDAGITPTSVSVAQGGTVTWVNNGKVVHTATSTGGGNPLPFDTGGLGPGQSGSLVFNAPGTYTYTSATDCVNKGASSFGCGPFTVIVGNGTVAPGTPAASSAPAVGNTTVTIDDKNGFTPSTLTINVGQTVTWTNSGANVHTTTSNPGYVGAWDSGGLNKGQSFAKTFMQPGTYGYHSQTEPVYTTDTSSGNVIVSYSFNGTIVVQ
jgi:plastocyanin